MANVVAKASSKPNGAFCELHGVTKDEKCRSAHLKGKPETFLDSCDIVVTVDTGEWFPAHKYALAAATIPWRCVYTGKSLGPYKDCTRRKSST